MAQQDPLEPPCRAFLVLAADSWVIGSPVGTPASAPSTCRNPYIGPAGAAAIGSERLCLLFVFLPFNFLNLQFQYFSISYYLILASTSIVSLDASLGWLNSILAALVAEHALLLVLIDFGLCFILVAFQLEESLNKHWVALACAGGVSCQNSTHMPT